MNTIQSVQSLRGLSQLAGAVAHGRPVREAVGELAGVVFAAKTGGAGSLASGLVASAVSSVVGGVADGASEVLDTASHVGASVAGYASRGARALGQLVDVFA